MLVQVPASALVADELHPRIGTALRAFASVPQFIEQGARAYLAARQRDVEARREEQRDMERNDSRTVGFQRRHDLSRPSQFAHGAEAVTEIVVPLRTGKGNVWIGGSS